MKIHFSTVSHRRRCNVYKGTEQCCSPHYPHMEIRTHYTRVAAFTLAARSFATNLQRAFVIYCALKSLAPDYLAELVSHRPFNRTLRSASLPALLFVPASLTVTRGDRRLAVCSAVLWNNITPSLRTAKSVFKPLLKAHLFKQVIS